MALPEEGKAAPAFTAKAHTGEKVSLKDFKGEKNVVLYFYPKDDTPGCTKEACGFRDNYAAFKERGIEVVGVSKDSPAKHQRFIGKYDLPFRLIADEDHSICEAYGTWGEKKMYGRTSMGIIRSTVVIDPMGVVHAVYPKVKPAEHAQQILDDLS